MSDLSPRTIAPCPKVARKFPIQSVTSHRQKVPQSGRLLIPEKHIALTQRIASFTAAWRAQTRTTSCFFCGKANHKTFQTFMKLGIPLVIDQLSIYSVWCVKPYSKGLFVSPFCHGIMAPIPIFLDEISPFLWILTRTRLS